MHELGLAEEIVQIAQAGAKGARVKVVTLEVGKLAAVLPDALRACFELAIAQTLLEGAALEIVLVPGQGRCQACGALVEMHAPFTRCSCGGSQLEWLSGEGLRVTRLEVV
jgi:hydrogenase nickel incorporation protein HypA/HybF